MIHKLTVNVQILKALTWAIVSKLASELSHFCLSPPWPDTYTSRSTILSQLPLLSQFLKYAPDNPVESPNEAATTLAAVFGSLLGVTSRLTFRDWIEQKAIRLGSRKTKTQSCLQRQYRGLICKFYEHAKDCNRASKMLAKSATKAKQATRTGPPGNNRVDRAHELMWDWLSTLTDMQGVEYVDIHHLSGVKGSIVLSREDVAEERQRHSAGVARRDSDASMSAQRVEEMVNPARRATASQTAA